MKKLTRPLKTVDYARRALRELKLMKHFCHENIISIIDVFTPLASEPEDMEEELVKILNSKIWIKNFWVFDAKQSFALFRFASALKRQFIKEF